VPFAWPGSPRLPFGFVALAGALVAFALGACSSTHFDGRVYKNGDLAFRVGPIPNNWRQIQADNTLLAFRDDARGTTIALNGRCGKDGDDVPLQALTHHLFLHFTDRKVVSQETETLDGRDALRTQIIAELDGVPKRFTVLVMKKDGCVYDFMRISASAEAEDDDFERFVRGFATLS
jgi:hypothetical protein